MFYLKNNGDSSEAFKLRFTPWNDGFFFSLFLI